MGMSKEGKGSGVVGARAEDSTSALIKCLSVPGGSGVRLQPQAPSDVVEKPSSQKPKPNLTSGKVQKMVFAPTIPTSRRIAKNDASNAKEQPKKKETKAVSTSDKKMAKRRERKAVIKSESVFSMGPAGKMTPGQAGVPSGSSSGSRGASGHGAGSRGSGGGGGSGGARGKVELEAIKEENSVDMMELPVADPEEDEFKLITSNKVLFKDSPLPPFQLPLDSSSSFCRPKNLKDEPCDCDPSAEEESSLTARVLTTASHTEDRNYFFMQLPDCLPIRTTDSGAGSTADAAQNPFCDVHEGRIGKLRIHRSGKVSLVLGAVSLDVSLGTPCGFLQEVACIRPSPPDCKVTSVGHVSTRLVCTPDFENVLS